MKFLRDFDFRNKRVLVRADFNVSFGSDNKVDGKEDWRITATLPTIKYLLEQKAKVILIAHLGRPNNRDKKYSLKPVAERLSELIKQKVLFFDDCIGKDVEQGISQLDSGEVVLLENLRFHPEEKENNSSFAKEISGLAEIYVNDAFGTSHRRHASIVGMPKYLPNCAGLCLEKEIRVLSGVLNEAERPLVVIIGGVKISTKIKVIKNFLEKADDLILGGALANTVISAKDFAIGSSISEEEMVEEVKRLRLTNTKLHIPVDVVTSADVSGKEESKIAPVGNIDEKEMILDIGPDTSKLFKQVISQAKMIVWNGPMGLFEVEKFASGSVEIAQAVAQSSGFSIVGGGDTVNLLEQLNLLDRIDHVSTGGGAMLKFLAGDKLPGIEALG